MDSSNDLPPDPWDEYLQDEDESLPGKHTPNSWMIKQIAAAQHIHLEIPSPSPIVPWFLTHNDRLFLKRLGIVPE